MAIRDALIVSLVGMGVVFLGLLLTSWLISAIALVPSWAGRRRQPKAAPPAPAPSAPVLVSPAAVSPAPDPDTATRDENGFACEIERVHDGIYSCAAFPPSTGRATPVM